MTNAEESAGAAGRDRKRIERALALLDAGKIDQAREELRDALYAPVVLAPPYSPIAPSRTASSNAFDHVLADDELDLAIASAETNPDEMLSANTVVAETLASHDSVVPDASFDFSEHPTYATRTMAELLEGQGRRVEADRVRARMPRVEDTGRMPLGSTPTFGVGDAERLRIVATLESWLHNIRRGMVRDTSASSASEGRGV
jgi:hypothetical protein